MKFDLDFLRQTGEALSSFGKKDEDKDTDIIRVEDLEKKDPATKIVETGYAAAAEKVYQEKEGKIVEKEKKEDTEDSLEKKLANIEKVIDTFSSGTKALPTGKLPGSNINADINQKPLDMGNVQAKAAQADYLKPSTVPEDRIALLYEDLKKYNLI
jgi:hypothetical protein